MLTVGCLFNIEFVFRAQKLHVRTIKEVITMTFASTNVD